MKKLIFKTLEDILKLTIKYTITAILILISSAWTYAEEGIYGSAGLRAIYSEDEDVSQNYYKAFTSMGWQNDLIDLSASYNRWISYSISDELYNRGSAQSLRGIFLYVGRCLLFSSQIQRGYSSLS
ncbi:MAG: hypothetical protein CVV49_04775 [Spirochaetae bacterium HGW-Spirochaetae-5]|nr:MAG: hypothetical protein CVV49_04775 [Spirochaetae bacterium HGW-Spirochaetae-5]